MSGIKVNFSIALRNFTNNEKEVFIEASSVREALERLVGKYGDNLREKIFESENKLRRFINIYINNKDMAILNGFETSLKAGDEITFLPTVSGGSASKSDDASSSAHSEVSIDPKYPEGRERAVVSNDITELIGRTPMVKINKLVGSNDASIYAKLEWYNIGGSIKDRMALFLIEYAEAAGKIKKDKNILEATSGNTGISLAMISAAKGYKIDMVMPESVSVERRRLIKAYGAKLILSPGKKGTWGAIELKQKMLSENPEKYIDIDQFKDPANILAHYHTTGKEILEQTNGKVDLVIIGVGTSGTGVGTSMRIKKHSPETRIVGVMPELGISIQGLRNDKEPYPTQLFRREWYDEIIEVSKEEVSITHEVARRVAKEEGLLLGMSAAAIMHIAIKKAKKLGKGKLIVAVLPDDGMKYLSTPLFE